MEVRSPQGCELGRRRHGRCCCGIEREQHCREAGDEGLRRQGVVLEGERGEQVVRGHSRWRSGMAKRPSEMRMGSCTSCLATDFVPKQEGGGCDEAVLAVGRLMGTEAP